MSDEKITALIAEAQSRAYYLGRYSTEPISSGLRMGKHELGKLAALLGTLADALEAAQQAPQEPQPEGPPVYTPTTREVRDQWASSPVYGYRDPMPARLAEFDRWLDSVRADAWDEGFEAGDVFDAARVEGAKSRNPYRSEKRDTLS